MDAPFEVSISCPTRWTKLPFYCSLSLFLSLCVCLYVCLSVCLLFSMYYHFHTSILFGESAQLEISVFNKLLSSERVGVKVETVDHMLISGMVSTVLYLQPKVFASYTRTNTYQHLWSSIHLLHSHSFPFLSIVGLIVDSICAFTPSAWPTPATKVYAHFILLPIFRSLSQHHSYTFQSSVYPTHFPPQQNRIKLVWERHELSVLELGGSHAWNRAIFVKPVSPKMSWYEEQTVNDVPLIWRSGE